MQDLKQQAQLALSLMDLTSLNDGDTVASIEALCANARSDAGQVAAVCVYPRFVPHARRALARAGAGITAVPDYFALPWVRQGGLRRILPTWSLPSHTAWAVFPGRRLMPAKTRAFIDMLQTALGGTG